MLNMDININDLPQEKKVEKIYTCLKQNSAFYKTHILAGIVKVPKDKKSNEPAVTYDELTRTKEHEEKIEDIIITLGMHGKIDLYLNHEKRLRRHEKDLKYVVHPLKFLGYIFSKPHLKAHMATILDDTFKRYNFISNLSKDLDYFYAKNQVTIYIEDFAKEVNIPAEYIAYYVNRRNWKGLVKYLTKY